MSSICTDKEKASPFFAAIDIADSNAAEALDQQDCTRDYPTKAGCRRAYLDNVIDTCFEENLGAHYTKRAVRRYIRKVGGVR